jgi:hypothetical protein
MAEVVATKAGRVAVPVPETSVAAREGRITAALFAYTL